MVLIANFILCVCLVCIIKPKRNKTNQNAYIYLTFILLFIIHAFVDINSVKDLDGYLDGYKEITKLSILEIFKYDGWYARFEMGYRYFNKICFYIFDDFRCLLLLYSYIFLKSYYYSIIRLSPYIWVSIALLLLGPFNQSIYVVRQHFAISILFATIPFFIKKQYLVTCLLALLALSLHTTAFIFFPVYFLYKIENKKRLILCLCFLGFVMSFAYNTYYSMTGELLSNYESYVNSEDSGQNSNEMLMAFAFLLSYTLVLKKHVFDEGVNKIVFIIAVLAFVFALVGTGFIGTGRLIMYFSIIPILLVPLTMYYLKKPVQRTFYCSVILLIKFYITFLGDATKEMVSSFQLCF